LSGIYCESTTQFDNGNYPVGSSIASDEQFSALESLFNQFYEWYVPKRVLGNKRRVRKEKKDRIQTAERDIISPHKANMKTDEQLINLTSEDEMGMISIFINKMLN